jgi:hypothetical protein
MNNPLIRKRDKLLYELYHRFTGNFLFEAGTDYGNNQDKDKGKEEQTKLENEISIMTNKIEEYENNKIFENAFEWRFEFPEVLNDEGDFVGFDIVIGNPPYIQSTSLDEQIKKYIYNNYKSAEYQINTYVVFIEKSLSILKNKYLYGLIIPNYWLSTKFDINLRRIVFNENNALSLLNTYRIFEDATVDTLVLIGIRTNIPNFPKTINIKSISNDLNSPASRLADLRQEVWNYQKELEVVNLEQDVKISFQKNLQLNGQYALGDFVHCFMGMKPYEKGKGDPPQTREMMNEKVYHSDLKKDDSYFPLIGSGNVQRYYVRKPSCFIKYGKNLAAPRKFEIFKGPRLLVNRIFSKDKIDVVYEDQIVINNTDVFNLVPKTEHHDKLLGLLAILASNTCAVYFKSSNINLDRKVFPKLNVNNLETFPIPEVSDETKLILNDKVNQILTTKKSDPTADTSSLESEIDQLVYELYGLTEEEIKIVEES